MTRKSFLAFLYPAVIKCWLLLFVNKTQTVSLRVDGKTLGKSFAFDTCVPACCIVSMEVSNPQMMHLLSAKKAETVFRRRPVNR
ncbi:invasion associated locus B family protein [Komagataeibacter pomaceti]|nr:invasion associated locus B family protein [Novacetimonas pomaceti]